MPWCVAEVSEPTEVGQNLSKLPHVYHLIVAGVLIPGFPGELAHIPALMVDVVKIAAELLRLPIQWLFRAAQRS